MQIIFEKTYSLDGLACCRAIKCADMHFHRAVLVTLIEPLRISSFPSAKPRNIGLVDIVQRVVHARNKELIAGCR